MSTPNPTHTDVIIEHRWDRITCRCSCRWSPNYSNTHKSGLEMHGEHVVSKLTDAGYSIVESIRVGSRVYVGGNLGTVLSVHGTACVVDFGDAGVYANLVADCTIAAAAEGEKP